MIWGIFLHGCYSSTKSLLKKKIRKQSNRSKCKVYPVALKKWPRWEVVNRKTATALILGKATAKRQSWRAPLPPRSQLDAVFSCCLSLVDSAENRNVRLEHCELRSQVEETAQCPCWVCWVVITRSDFPPYFLNRHLHTGSVQWKDRGRGLPLIPMRCSCVLSLVAWGDGRNHRVVDSRLADAELKAACQSKPNILDLARTGWWVCGPENAIHHLDF